MIVSMVMPYTPRKHPPTYHARMPVTTTGVTAEVGASSVLWSHSSNEIACIQTHDTAQEAVMTTSFARSSIMLLTAVAVPMRAIFETMSVNASLVAVQNE